MLNAYQMLRLTLIAAIIFIAALVFYVYAALNLPTLFNLDNQNNYAATRYISEHYKIPVVEIGDEDITFTEIGTTRSLRPPFTYIVSALVANFTTNFVDDSVLRLRLGSPLLGALTITIIFTGFYLAFSHIGLALFGSLSIALLPKFVFLASSNNDDIGAILSVSVLFTSVLGAIKYRNNIWPLIALAFSFGLVLQTKYTAWLTLPWFGLVCIFLVKPIWHKVFKVLPLLVLVFIAAGGWWVIFNIANYGIDDPTALRHASEIQRSLNSIEPNQQGYASEGVGVLDLLSNHDQFLSKSYRSLIGYLEWLELDLSKSTYFFYGIIFLVGVIAVTLQRPAAHKKTSYLDYLILMMLLSQLMFYLHHNWLRDIQPQARYVLPMIMPLVYLFLRWIDQIPSKAIQLTINERTFTSQTVLSFALCLLSAIIFHYSWAQHITPIYQTKPYFTSINNVQEIDINGVFSVISSSSTTYEFIDNSFKIERTSLEPSTLELDESLCKTLPINAVILVDVFASTKGSFSLGLEQRNSQRYNNIIWHPFPAGNSTASLSLNSLNCTGAKITLSKNTYGLSLSNLRIGELKIHQHGKPI